jgi:oxygen-independent coproporphyrinogen-3 oxidase
MARSLYIHIPFCRRKCVYCNFYSDIYNEDTASSYTDILISQIRSLGGAFRTLYIGGGTPTSLDIRLLEKLLDSLKPLIGGGEFTIEANPESLDGEKLALMLDSGVNRISIGLQSADDRKLKRLGRLHNARKAVETVLLASKKGFKNISIDLIFGVWDEDEIRWKNDLEEAASLPVNHISCYELTYEKGTPLAQALAQRSIVPLEDETVAGMYGLAIDLLALRGFKQYEVSNFAIPGYESRHNLNYWNNDPYVGLGPSAFSYIEGTRQRNVPDVKEYINRAASGKSVIDFTERLPPVKSARETAAVKIRTKEGIDFAWFRERTGFDFTELEKKALPGLFEKDLIKYKRENNAIAGVCLKRKGFLFCDTVSSALL